MFDLGTSFVASVARDPAGLAIVDGQIRLSYHQWFRRISALVAGLGELGLRPGDHLITVLQNRWEAASLHWACQLAGIIITPLNWRSKLEELEFYIEDAEAKAIVYEAISAAAVRAAWKTRLIISLDRSTDPAVISFEALLGTDAGEAVPQVNADACSVMLYTSGTTAKPKGVPRSHRAERAATLAHVAQNRYGRCERTLGVMPLYHTMGIRSLLAMSLVGGTFMCMVTMVSGSRLMARASARM